MFSWIAENAGTIFVVLIVAGMALGAALSLRRQKKAGKSTCGCGCASCAMSGACHKDQ